MFLNETSNLEFLSEVWRVEKCKTFSFLKNSEFDLLKGFSLV